MGRSWLQRAGIVIAWLAIWQVAALAIGNELLFCGPADVLAALAHGVTQAAFWMAVALSFARIATGFAVALACGIVLGALAARYRVVEAFLSPLVHVVKSAPVVCVIAILLVLFGSRAATSIVVAMVTFPPVYLAMIEAAETRDRTLGEMARVFGMGACARAAFLELAHYRPFLRAAFKTSIGMSWKAGVAAELIGLPGASIGEAVYLAKLSIDVPELIAWTAVVILLGWACEKLFLAAFDLACGIPVRVLDARVRRTRMHATVEDAPAGDVCARGCDIELSGVGLRYGALRVLDGFDLLVDAGTRACVMAPSGSGKTTLLGLMMRLRTANAGSVRVDGAVSTVFQEARLVEERTAAENLALVAGDEAELARGLTLLERLLGDAAGWEDKPASELSGGMRRRVELARALAHPSCAVLLDEPFAGLDDESRRAAAAVTLDALGGRTLVVATHNAEDAELLDARVVRM